MTTLRKQVEQMARNAKKAGFSRNKAFRHAPTKPSLRDMFMAEYDRYQPRETPELFPGTHDELNKLNT